jgi:Ion channel
MGRRAVSAAKTLESRYQRFIRWQERTREPGLTALMFIEGALLFVVTPFVGIGWLPQAFSWATFALLALAILIVTSRSRTAASIVLVSVILSPVGTSLHAEYPSVLTEWLSAGGRLVAIGTLSIVVAKAVFGPGRVTWHRVQGAVVLYMNFALFFFILYQFINVLIPDAFRGLPQNATEHESGAALLYFSFATLTTAGFGDITPVHAIARSLANLEAVLGQLFPATLLARIVTLEIAHARESKK